MEELLFRGLLLTALRTRLGSVDAAALSAALFAVRLREDAAVLCALCMLLCRQLLRCPLPSLPRTAGAVVRCMPPLLCLLRWQRQPVSGPYCS